MLEASGCMRMLRVGGGVGVGVRSELELMGNDGDTMAMSTGLLDGASSGGASRAAEGLR